MSGTRRIVIVDDEPSICWGLTRLLRQSGYEIEALASAEEALPAIRERGADLVLMDVRLPGMDGLAALEQIRRDGHAMPVVVITAFGDLRTAVEALEHGAIEYLTKPFDLGQVRTVIDRVFGALKHAQASAAPAARSDPLADELLGRSGAMQGVFKRIALAAPAEIPVLITGESGTGKELVARAIHRHSHRADKPLLTVNLAALSPSLIESELFGHVRGAFTGAETSRKGLLELAHGATLFFDEVGDVPLFVQVKLLRVLEQHEVMPIGDATPRPCDFRVIAATHRDLASEIRRGRFRQDFYFRLAGFDIPVPPLRARTEDIGVLANHFLTRSGQPNQPSSTLTAGAVRALEARPWFGNVRELRSVIERAALMARGLPITPAHLAPFTSVSHAAEAEAASTLAEAVRQWACRELEDDAEIRDLYARFRTESERVLFDEVMERTDQNQRAAARILGLHRQTLRKKLHRLHGTRNEED